MEHFSKVSVPNFMHFFWLRFQSFHFSPVIFVLTSNLFRFNCVSECWHDFLELFWVIFVLLQSNCSLSFLFDRHIYILVLWVLFKVLQRQQTLKMRSRRQTLETSLTEFFDWTDQIATVKLLLSFLSDPVLFEVLQFLEKLIFFHTHFIQFHKLSRHFIVPKLTNVHNSLQTLQRNIHHLRKYTFMGWLFMWIRF